MKNNFSFCILHVHYGKMNKCGYPKKYEKYQKQVITVFGVFRYLITNAIAFAVGALGSRAIYTTPSV